MNNNPEYLTDYSLNQQVLRQFEHLQDSSHEIAANMAEQLKQSNAEFEEHQTSN